MQVLETSGDHIVDNLSYLFDMLADMLSMVDTIKSALPPREVVHNASLSDDITAVNDLNRIMANTSTLVWSVENTKILLDALSSEILESG